ncbi:MAG: VOC family protein [Streptomycetaceae bacterium]|nr:VOC family protein [Streptomycetaceae bacterium]
MTFQITIDCAKPDLLAPFWAAALGYRAADPPEGHASWREFYLSVGVPAEELGDGDCVDRLVDPTGAGPAIWSQIVPEPKTLKNRLHFDLMVGGGRSVPVELRRQRVDAEVTRLTELGATVLRRSDDELNGHYAVTLADPERNEFCVA